MKMFQLARPEVLRYPVKDAAASLICVLFCSPEDVHSHLMKCEVEYLQFAFRWMNNLLMRELPLRCTIRLWDTYQVRHRAAILMEQPYSCFCVLFRLNLRASHSSTCMSVLRFFWNGVNRSSP